MIYKSVSLTKGEFREIDKALLATVRCVVGQGLAHQVGLEPSSCQALLHELHRLQAGCGVEMAVHPHDGGTCKQRTGESRPALASSGSQSDGC